MSVPAVEPLVLTDVELAVLCGPHGLAYAPFLVSVPDNVRDTALATAFLGLLARGLVEPPSAAATVEAADREAEGISTQVRADVGVVVAARTAPEVAVAVARTSEAGQDYWYAYRYEDAVLVEEVSGNGLHRFTWGPADELTALVVDACLALDATDGDGKPVLLPRGADDPEPPVEIARVLGRSALHTALAVRRGDDPLTELSIFSGAGGCWLARPAKDGPHWWAVPGPVDRLRTMIARTVDGDLGTRPTSG